MMDDNLPNTPAMMKVPPLKINLKEIETHEKHDKHDKHERHEKHKKHKKHKKNKHKHHHHHHHHHHHNHDHHTHHQQTETVATVVETPAPILDPVHTVADSVGSVTESIAPATEPVALVAETPAAEGNSVTPVVETVAPIVETTDPIADTVASVVETATDMDIVAPVTELPKEDPTSKLSYLRKAEDGTVRLAIIGPTRQPMIDEEGERVINLEQVCGQLQDGLDVIPSHINEEEVKEQIKVNPIAVVEQPAFGTHLPHKNSTFANLSGKDSEVLLEIYGDNQTCVDYADSIRSFVAGTNYPMQMADSLLNLLTENRHEEVMEVQRELNELDDMLNQLRQVQESRLSTSPAPVEPSEAETELADKILQKMTKLIKNKMKPGEIAESSSILKALGLGELA